MKTKVVRCGKEKYDVYIGRPSIFGNPFEIGKDGNREDVIKKYREYFYERIEKDINFRAKIRNLKGKILGCWCKPEDCHGDIIVDFLLKEQLYP
jgi:hypothetical protein